MGIGLCSGVAGLKLALDGSIMMASTRIVSMTQLNWPQQSRRCWVWIFAPPLSLSITAQVEAHTCGTVALMHLFHILNPGLMVPPQAVKIIHDWIFGTTYPSR